MDIELFWLRMVFSSLHHWWVWTDDDWTKK